MQSNYITFGIISFLALSANSYRLADQLSLRFLNSLREGEFIESVESLHCFFDYYMYSKDRRSIAIPIAYKMKRNETENHNENSQSQLQYAALELAALFWRFGFRQETIDVIIYFFHPLDEIAPKYESFFAVS